MSKFLKSNATKVVLGFAAFAFAVSGAGVAQAYTFTAPTLKQGSKGAAVMELQKALNMCADTMVATTGVGSSGYESTSFGSKTKAAVKAWQAKMGLTADGVFGPASRAAMNANGCGSSSSNNGGQTTQTGPVTAMLSTDNPAAGTLVASQATADLAHFTFSGSGVVTNVTLQRTGVSADATLSNVYLFDGATRLTDASSVANNGMITFNIPAGIFSVSGMKNIKVKSDIASGSQGQTVGVKLVSFATASGTTAANISGNIHTIASATLATVSAGTVTPTGATINPGAAVTLWQSTLTIGQRDVWMKRVAFRNTGSAPASAFQNFKLYVNGSQVGSAAGMDSMGYVTFDLSSSPVNLVAGSRILRVDADVVSGASRTVSLSLRQAADVDFVDSSFGVNIAPTSTPWAPASVSTIAGTNGGSLTIEKDVSSPSTNLVNNGTDVNLGTFKFTAFGEAMKVETLRVSYDSSDNNIASLRNGRVLVNGVQYGSTATLNEKDSGSAYTTYTLNYTVMPGTPVLVEVHADIYDNDGTDSITAGTDTINAQISAGSYNVLRVDSLGYASYPASSAVTSNTRTIATTAMTLTKNGTYANQSISLPATNFKLGSWNLAGSSVEDILLTTLSFDLDEANATTDFDEEDVTNMYAVVKVNGTVVAQASPLSTLSSDGQDNNFSINYTLAKNTNASIELYANLSDTGTPSTVDTSDAIVTDLTVTGTSLVGGSSVTATSADTAGQTITAGSASLTVTEDSSSPVSAIVYDNQTVEVADLKFAALTSGYNVTDAVFTMGSTATRVVSNVMLYDGSTLIASAPAAATTSFAGMAWNVPANTNKILTVKLQLSSIDINTQVTGIDITPTLASATATKTSDGGQASATVSDGTGSSMYAFASVPVITKQTLESSQLQNVDGTPLLKFKIDATGGPVGWYQLYFNVTKDAGTKIASSTSAGITLWDVTNGGNTQISGTFTNTNLHATGSTTGTIKFVPTAEQQISSSKTYELRGIVTGADADGDFVTTTLSNTNTSFSAATSATSVTGASTAPIIWSDTSASSHATSTSDWANDFGVKNLPVSASLNW